MRPWFSDPDKRGRHGPDVRGRQYNDEQLAVLRAVAEYRQYVGRQPSVCEMFEIVLGLGYRRVAAEGEYVMFSEEKST